MIALAEKLTTAPLAPAPVLGDVPAERGVGPPRFTIDGDAALEQHLERSCAQVVSGIRGLIPPRKLEAVLLGGGYGRGEGGVLRAAGGNRPYNDLEFYVAIAGNRHTNEFLYQRRLQVLAEILTHLAGVEVEFKITSLAELGRRPVSMFSYDFVVGHRLLWSAAGAPGLTGCDHHRCAGNIPPEEATRLLMNRCSGLLFARARLAQEPFTPAAADFVHRNIAKVQLAMGDAVLAAHGLYHWSCRERYRRLKGLALAEPSAWLAQLLFHHAFGVEFKLHPTAGATSRETLAERHGEVAALALQCWLWLEGRRLGRPFASARVYALDAADQSPGSSGLRNFALNFRADGFQPRCLRRPWRHPRQRIFRALMLMLWEPAVLSDRRLHLQLERDLNARISNFAQALVAYEELWSRVR